jgi:hypothetical protein
MIKSSNTKCEGHIARGAKINTYRVLVGKPEGKRSLGRGRCKWQDNNRINLRETGQSVMD